MQIATSHHKWLHFIFLANIGCMGESTGESPAARETDPPRSPACEVIDCCVLQVAMANFYHGGKTSPADCVSGC